MPKGYYTGYSYCGIMPDGRKAYFASDAEYKEAFEEEAKESRPSLFRIFYNGLSRRCIKCLILKTRKHKRMMFIIRGILHLG